MTNPYDVNPTMNRPGNGSAHDLLSGIYSQGGWQQGGQPQFSNLQQQPFAQHNQMQQQYAQMPQQQFAPNPQQQFQYPQNPQQQQVFGQNLQPWSGAGQQPFGFSPQQFGQAGGSQSQNYPPQYQPQSFGQHQHPGLQPGTGFATGVVTTKAVEVNVNIPAQRVIGRHPMEVQQYVLQVVLPVLLDGLVKRATLQDIGQSVSSDFRECIVRIEI